MRRRKNKKAFYSFKEQILSYPKLINNFGVEMYCSDTSYIYIFLHEDFVIQFCNYLMGDGNGNYIPKTIYQIFDLKKENHTGVFGSYNKEVTHITKEEVSLMTLKYCDI